MRKEIWRILKDLENEKVTTNEAYHLLCDLFAVSGRSEQLVCDKCVEDLSKSKSFKKGTCVHCRKEIEQTNCH